MSGRRKRGLVQGLPAGRALLLGSLDRFSGRGHVQWDRQRLGRSRHQCQLSLYPQCRSCSKPSYTLRYPYPRGEQSDMDCIRFAGRTAGSGQHGDSFQYRHPNPCRYGYRPCRYPYRDQRLWYRVPKRYFPDVQDAHFHYRRQRHRPGPLWGHLHRFLRRRDGHALYPHRLRRHQRQGHQRLGVGHEIRRSWPFPGQLQPDRKRAVSKHQLHLSSIHSQCGRFT